MKKSKVFDYKRFKSVKLSKPTLLLSALLFAGLGGGYFLWRGSASTDAPVMLAKPYVKLFSQVGGSGSLDANSLSQYYAHIHGEGSNPSSFQLKNSGLGGQLISKDLWASQYRNGSYVSQANSGTDDPLFIEANDIEHNAPLAIATFWPGDWAAGKTDNSASVLPGSLDSASTSITLKLAALKPSGDSQTWPYINSKDTNGDGYSNNTADYVAWIRIDNEIMQVTAPPTLQGSNVVLTVKRGIWGTAKANHSAASKVLSPAYIGSAEMSGTPSTDNSQKPLRYVVKFWTPDGYKWQADRILKTLGDGKTAAQGGKLVHYDTVWLDVSSCNQYNIADPFTKPIEIWDDLSGIRMTKDNWGKYQRWKLNGQNEVGGGLRDLVKHQNPAVKVKFTGNSMLKDVNDSCNTDLLSNLYDGGSLEGWLKGDFASQMALGFAIQKNDWPGLFWVRDENGYGGQVPYDKKFAHRRFTYGSYLLAYNKNATKPQYGLTWGLNKPDNMYFYDFGDPIQAVSGLAGLSLGGELYSRQYSKGLVVVNNSSTQQTYTLNKKYYQVGGFNDAKTDLDSAPQEVSGQITIGPKDSALLLNPLASDTNDTQAPTTPTNLNASSVTDNSAVINWVGSSDNIGVTGYKVSRDGTQVGTSTSPSFTDTGLAANKTYSYTVIAFDAVGNNSPPSSATSVTTLNIPDTATPTTPASFTATAVSSSQINLNWSASTDNVGVVDYEIYQNDDTRSTSTNGLSFEATNLNASSAYSYRIRARDAAGNVSGFAESSATTKSKSTVATLSGTVNSLGGGAIPGAKIIVIGNWFVSSYSTNNNGVYQISNLRPGPYLLIVAANNHIWQVEKNINLTAGTLTTRDISLKKIP